MASSNPDIVGIDFSGAQDAGRHIWIAEGTVSSGELSILQCNRASDIFGRSDKTLVFEELVDWIESLATTTVGIDFPFGVPEVIASVMFEANSWSGFVDSQLWSGLTPDRFRQQCKNLSNSEVRDTDALHRADCPHDLRIYKQTFHGIRDILKPLLDRDVSVAPMVNNGNPTVLETYPAATLAREDDLFAASYKNDRSSRNRMAQNVQALSGLQDLNISAIPNNKIIDNQRGDALDSIIAALATFRAGSNSNPFWVNPQTPIEGHIYV